MLISIWHLITEGNRNFVSGHLLIRLYNGTLVFSRVLFYCLAFCHTPIFHVWIKVRILPKDSWFYNNISFFSVLPYIISPLLHIFQVFLQSAIFECYFFRKSRYKYLELFENFFVLYYLYLPSYLPNSISTKNQQIKFFFNNWKCGSSRISDFTIVLN